MTILVINCIILALFILFLTVAGLIPAWSISCDEEDRQFVRGAALFSALLFLTSIIIVFSFRP